MIDKQTIAFPEEAEKDIKIKSLRRPKSMYGIQIKETFQSRALDNHKKYRNFWMKQEKLNDTKVYQA
jgi:CRISPR/Cas system-associated protein Csx1